MYRESDIIRETGKFWVLRERSKPGLFKVLEVGATCSRVRDTVQFSNDPAHAERLAIEKCEAREAAADRRYSIALEHCGAESPRFVIRFADDWVAAVDSRIAAEAVRFEHWRGRDASLRGAAGQSLNEGVGR